MRYIFFIALVYVLSCGDEEKKKKSPSTQRAEGIPSGWDGKSDWKAGLWEIGGE